MVKIIEADLIDPASFSGEKLKPLECSLKRRKYCYSYNNACKYYGGFAAPNRKIDRYKKTAEASGELPPVFIVCNRPNSTQFIKDEDDI